MNGKYDHHSRPTTMNTFNSNILIGYQILSHFYIINHLKPAIELTIKAYNTIIKCRV